MKKDLPFKKSIATVVYDHDIPSDLVINLDRAPLFYVFSQKCTFNLNGVTNVPIKSANDKRQITTTFTVSTTINLLPTQLIYTTKNRKCLQNVEFPRSFYVTYTKNHWSNHLKATEHFKKVIFPYLDQIKEKMVHPKEQMSLVVKDTFNGRDNNDLREPSARNNREIVVTLHNLTNKFQPIDLNVNKAAKAYVSLCWQIEFQNNSKEA